MIFNKLVRTLQKEIADIYARAGENAHKVIFWQRSLHKFGSIFAFRFGPKEEDFPVLCFAIDTEGKITRGKHEDLVQLFTKEGSVAIGNKKKYHDKF